MLTGGPGNAGIVPNQERLADELSSGRAAMARTIPRRPAGYNSRVPQGIEPSNLDKVFWPDSGLTKGELMRYLEAVAPLLVPVLRDRPLTVKRYPDGIDGFMFFQKNVPKYAPEWVQTVPLPSGGKRKEVRYILCNSKRTLLWLGNQASIEFHPWLSRADRVHRPDQLVLDIDPSEDDFARAVDVALLMKEVLDESGLEGVAKTSGAKGVHVYVPLQRRHTYSAVRAAAVRLGRRAEERAPDLATTAFHVKKRGGRVFLDPGRNAPGAHVVAPYSPRAHPEATVSFPVEWKDLKRIRPEDFTIRNVPDLVERQGDRWTALLPRPQALPRSLGEPPDE
jgi:bifunctional non-homologous end joining protein LigD